MSSNRCFAAISLPSRVSAALLAVACAAAVAACAGAAGEDSNAAAADIEGPVASRPPMGWSSWNTFACNIREDLIRTQADALVTSGMRDLGYVYVNLDDCWMAPERDANGDLQADPVRFPSGIAALAAAMHARGLKLGIYSSPGPQTCQGRGLQGLTTGPHPGSEGHEAQDAARFASWGIDYLKYDRCTAPKEDAERRFSLMHDALASTGRRIVYSINPDGATAAKPWSTYANLWRTTPDVDPTWHRMWWSEGWWSTGIIDIVDQNAPLYADASPGHWNDPDMLEVGVRKPFLWTHLQLTDIEARTQLSMWAMMAAPLIAGNDLTAMSDATRATLGNAEVIAIDQDAAGVQGRRVSKNGDVEVWAKPLAHGGVAVALLNRSTRAANVEAKWRDVGVSSARANVRDVWAHADRGIFAGSYAAQVAGHGVVVVKVVPALP
jgi:alpha-galactosidase